MTLEEIKAHHSMREVVESYGVKVRRDGMCRCPIHGERHPSMKVYKDSFNCFSCGANGDVITFIQLMDKCDFKSAFYSLGGSYEKPTKESKLAIYRLQKARESKQLREQALKEKMYYNNVLINIYVSWIKKSEPYSDTWCDCQNALMKCLYLDEEYTKELEEGK